ncbi:MAG: hypothetical protein NZM38_07120 [Cytophagales bacterium]|nr:hypothetical protein [Cytophagales bacterium]MDW8384527.1 hypothetical protein [Flammeovirgaceae bacterium]
MNFAKLLLLGCALLGSCVNATNNYMNSVSTRSTRTNSPATVSSKSSKKQPKIRIITPQQTKEFQEERRTFYQKMEYEMEKPQYKDPTYFGHKRKPKKRPPGKQKYCKECGMKH